MQVHSTRIKRELNINIYKFYILNILIQVIRQQQADDRSFVARRQQRYMMFLQFSRAAFENEMYTIDYIFNLLIYNRRPKEKQQQQQQIRF